MSAIVFEDAILVPDGINDFASFRRWVHEEDFPAHTRVDFVAERIEFDMSPEELFTHGRLKAEFARVIGNICEQSNELMVFVDSTRVSAPVAKLSTEPDIVVISRRRIRAGDLRLVQTRPGRYVEIEGGPDVVVEIVSESSVQKDTVRLPQAHFQAGTLEYWLVDARDPQQLIFKLQRRGETGFSAVDSSQGWQDSNVLERQFRLTVESDEDSWPEFTVHCRTRA